jgi:pimeloyl-ACP methyl ester carboxylesterase
VVWGDEAKAPLVLVHGGRDHARSWDFVARALIDRFAVYALDLRGHGDSDWATGGQYRLSDHVLDLAKLIKVLDRGPVNVIAHSMGGRVTLDYGGAFSETLAKIVVIEGFGWRDGPHQSPAHELRSWAEDLWELEQRREHVYSTFEAAARRMQEANKRLTPALVRHLTEHAVRLVEGGYVWKFDHYIRLNRPAEWTVEETKELWRRILAPTLLVWGASSDRRMPGRDEFSSLLPQARSLTFENAGHWVHHDQLDAFVAAVREFMA